jgi:hypothetical protein
MQGELRQGEPHSRSPAARGAHFLQVLITIVAADGEVGAVKVKGSRTGWIPIGRAVGR